MTTAMTITVLIDTVMVRANGLLLLFCEFIFRRFLRTSDVLCSTLLWFASAFLKWESEKSVLVFVEAVFASTSSSLSFFVVSFPFLHRSVRAACIRRDQRFKSGPSTFRSLSSHEFSPRSTSVNRCFCLLYGQHPLPRRPDRRVASSSSRATSPSGAERVPHQPRRVSGHTD